MKFIQPLRLTQYCFLSIKNENLAEDEPMKNVHTDDFTPDNLFPFRKMLLFCVLKETNDTCKTEKLSSLKCRCGPSYQPVFNSKVWVVKLYCPFLEGFSSKQPAYSPSTETEATQEMIINQRK